MTLTVTTPDLYTFVAKGCVFAPAAITNGIGEVTDVPDNLSALVAQGAFIQ